MKVTDNEEPPKTTVKETNRGTLIIGPWKGSSVPSTKKVVRTKKTKKPVKPQKTLKASIKKKPRPEPTEWGYQTSPVGVIWIIVPSTDKPGLTAVKFTSLKEYQNYMLFKFKEAHPKANSCIVVNQPVFYMINDDDNSEDDNG